MQSAARLVQHGELIKRMARVENIGAVDKETPKGAVQIILEGTTYFLPVGDVIDISKRPSV